MANVLKKKDLAFSQVGFGPEHGIDSIGSYWFYCNASNVFVQECLLCTTDLSHVTVFRRAETLISGWPCRSGEQETSTSSGERSVDRNGGRAGGEPAGVVSREGRQYVVCNWGFLLDATATEPVKASGGGRVA